MIEEDVETAIENNLADYQSPDAFMVPTDLCKINIETRQCASTELKPKIKSWCDDHISVQYDHIEIEHVCIEDICHGGYHVDIIMNAAIDLLVLRFASIADWLAFRLRWL